MNNESENIEFKASFGMWKEIVISLSAFANKNGGKVIVGLRDDGSTANLQIGKRTIEDFVNKLQMNTDPILYPAIDVKSFALGEIVEIEVHPSDFKPVFAFHRAYSRVGKSNLIMSANEIRSLALRYERPDYDQMKYEGDDSNSIDIDLINDIGYKTSDIILKGEYLCFVKDDLSLHNACAKAGLFKGSDMSKVLDMKDFISSLLKQSVDLLDYIKRQINMEVVLDGQSKRKELWDYPIEALRESINNAIVHRDYQDSGNIQIRIYDHSLEIWSPGLLPKELRIANLPDTTRSIPRNKKIAEIFYKAGIIENWGSGFQRIASSCKLNNNPLPEWKEETGAFITVYKKRNHEGVNEGVNEEVNEGVNEGVNIVIDYITKKPGMRTPQIAKALNVHPKTMERWLSKLKGQAKIYFKGSPKMGGYYISNY